MNILMIWEERPSPYSGTALPAFNVLKHLSRSHTIRLLYLNNDLAAPRSYPELERYCSQIDPVPWHPQSHSSKLLSVARDSCAPRKLFSDYRCFLTTAYLPAMASLIQDVRHDKYDIVYASEPVAFYAWRFSTPKVMHAFDCRSAEFYREYLRARRSMDKLYWFCTYLATRSAEKKLLAAFDASIVVNDKEYHAMKMLCPEAKCAAVPNGVDTDFFKPLGISEEWPSLVFVGYMSSHSKRRCDKVFSFSGLRHAQAAISKPEAIRGRSKSASCHSRPRQGPVNLRDGIRGGRASVCCPCFSCNCSFRIGNGNKKQGLGGDGHGKACGHYINRCTRD